MKTVKPILITLLIASIIYGSVVVYGQLVLLKKITYKFKKYYFEHFTLTDARLIVTIEITNTSDIDFIIKGGNFNVSLNDIPVATVITTGAVLPKHLPASIDLQIDFNPTDVFKTAIPALITNPGNIKITVDGTVTLLSNFLILNKLKVNQSMTLAEIMAP